MQALTDTSPLRPLVFVCLLAIYVSLSGCTTPQPPQGMQVHMPLKQGWFEGQAVFYVTTDVSDLGAAKDLKANFAPRLAYAITAATADKSAKPSPSSVDKV
jgi:hypothetical protein